MRGCEAGSETQTGVFRVNHKADPLTLWGIPEHGLRNIQELSMVLPILGGGCLNI